MMLKKRDKRIISLDKNIVKLNMQEAPYEIILI